MHANQIKTMIYEESNLNYIKVQISYNYNKLLQTVFSVFPYMLIMCKCVNGNINNLFLNIY